jgi:hypothetical protein
MARELCLELPSSNNAFGSLTFTIWLLNIIEETIKMKYNEHSLLLVSFGAWDRQVLHFFLLIFVFITVQVEINNSKNNELTFIVNIIMTLNLCILKLESDCYLYALP